MTWTTPGVQSCVSVVDESVGVEVDIHRWPNSESLEDHAELGGSQLEITTLEDDLNTSRKCREGKDLRKCGSARVLGIGSDVLTVADVLLSVR